MNGFLHGVCVQRTAIRFRQAFIFSIIPEPTAKAVQRSNVTQIHYETMFS